MAIYYIDRKSGEKRKEIVAGEGFLKWTYESTFGKSLLEIFIKKKVFSFIYGKLQDTRFSSRKIEKFVKALEINMDEANKTNINDYSTFNEFFARKLKTDRRPINYDKNILISPADGRVLAYENINMDKVIQVKGSYYTLGALLQNSKLSDQYDKGTCIIIRLCPSDYHRFHFPDEGIPEDVKKINGYYYSVNPLSLEKITELYCQNKREITIFHSTNFDEILLIEVGATCVGSIIQTFEPFRAVAKGEEKGYFKFGGSTVIMILKKNLVKIDDDIIENTSKGLETKVNMGNGIGYLIK